MLRRFVLFLTVLALVAISCLGTFLWFHSHGLIVNRESSQRGQSVDERRSADTGGVSPSTRRSIAGKTKSGSQRTDGKSGYHITELQNENKAEREAQTVRSISETNGKLQALESQINVLRSQIAEQDAQSQQAQAVQKTQLAVAESLRSELKMQHEEVSQLRSQRSESGGSDPSEANGAPPIRPIQSATMPVYNASFFPTADSKPSGLIDGKKTLFRFFIGPNSSNNAIGQTLAVIAHPLTESTSDVPLSITMDCGFCSGRRTDLIKVVYHGRTKLSSEAQFHIVPNLALAQSLGAAVILVDIRNSDTAVRYNRLAINVAVHGARSIQGRVEQIGLEEGTFTPQVVDTRSFKPDVIVTLRPEYGKPFDLGFEAINPELRKRLSGLEQGKKQIDGVRQVQFFHTYDLTSSELRSKQAETLTALRGLMDQQNADLQQALATSASGAVVLDTSDFVELSPSDQSKAFSTFAQLGDYLYTRLFLNSSAALKDVVETMEKFEPSDKHPVRILIKTSGQALPWQLLHVPSAKEDDGFWGMKFELAVEDMSRPNPGVALKRLDSDRTGVSLFGTYVGADYSVQALGGQQVKYFSKAFPTKQLIPASSSITFADSLKKKSSNLDIILVYTHGSDGWVSQQVNGQYIRFQLDPPGQRLIFSQDGSSIKPTDITALANGFDTSNGSFLRRNPVVLLNACETGMLITDEFTLPQAFLHLGARGVIATEAPVSNQFALLFGNSLIDQMAQGEDMAAGVFNVRQKFLSRRNPLGLVYSYYMNDGIAEVAAAK